LRPTLVPSDRAPGLFVTPGTVIPDDAEIAPHVTIYAGVDLGLGVSLEQGAIIGRPQQIDARSRSPARAGAQVTVIGEGARVGSSTVVVAGARIGARVYLSDHVLVREGATVAEDAMIGRGTSVTHDVVVGARTRIQNNSLVGPSTVIEEDVLVSPRVTFVGDPTMGRRSAEAAPPGILVRRASRIGTGAILFPPCEIGEEAVVGAAAMVRADVPPRTVVAGTPARPLRAVRDDELLESWRRPA
jgi:UDP-2-acetamido-3-amino-2,3-dideoxy-glucuronate N-acetyltransferase